jgi:hypothetical protein
MERRRPDGKISVKPTLWKLQAAVGTTAFRSKKGKTQLT